MCRMISATSKYEKINITYVKSISTDIPFKKNEKNARTDNYLAIPCLFLFV